MGGLIAYILLVSWARSCSSPSCGPLKPGHEQQTCTQKLQSFKVIWTGRYQTEVGTGRFKHVYKGFDERRGIDVAWSKILQSTLDLDDAEMQNIVGEMATGLGLDHQNIIRCYRTWQDEEKHCINLITEFFTSGNLREYRQRHKHLELKAVKKWARQLLSGLEYLHSKEPPIVHGDLRCDKVYINGHSGEIKIGDLGLATLLPRRFSPGGSHCPKSPSVPSVPLSLSTPTP